MKINEKTFRTMPAELQALFSKCPNPGSDEVVGLFPETGKGKASKRGADRNGNVYGKYGKLDTVRGHNDNGGSAARFFYCAKASKRDRDEGCEGMEERHRILSNQAKAELKRGNTEYKEDAGKLQMGGRIPSRNHHPTVKPTDLMRYLCRLITPPGGTVLDPFTGSGSTGKAAVLEGFSFIGCEIEQEYIDIARARIEHAVHNS